MSREQLARLIELMALEFTVLDLHLYLDTHPTDQRALSDHQILLRQLAMLKRGYEDEYGPLTPDSGAGAEWIKEPWPWQINYEREE